MHSRPVLVGAPNFRSLLGLRARDGRRIDSHVVLRSDQLCNLNEQDLSVLRRVGLRTVFDLRSDGERRRSPNRLPDGAQECGVPVLADLRADEGIAELLRQHPDPNGVRRVMLDVYARLPAAVAFHLPRIFDALDREAVPMLIHCAAGKDRTGFTVAVVLHALDISPDDIMDDYQLSSRLSVDPPATLADQVARLLRRLTAAPPSDEMIRSLIEVRPEYLHAAYDAVRRYWGSMDAYLVDTCALDAPRLQRLRDRWLAG